MKACIWYFDLILIHGANSEGKHQRIVQKVLQQCMEHGLAGNLFKSKFHVYETILLRHVIYSQQVKMDSSKLESMSKWPSPIKKKEVQGCLGFENYYYQFIVNYSAEAPTLIDITKDIPFS